MRVGLYGGSFDPVHLGHLALVTAASEHLDRLVVVVAANAQKRTAMFTVDQRVRMLQDACRHLDHVSVTARRGLLVDIAADVGAHVLVRSAGKEHADELRMAYFNGCEGLPTVLVPPDPTTASISSTQIRSYIAAGAVDRVAACVPSAVMPVVYELFARHAPA